MPFLFVPFHNNVYSIYIGIFIVMMRINIADNLLLVMKLHVYVTCSYCTNSAHLRRIIKEIVN